MPTVVAVVMRGGRIFSGGATAHVVGDVGADVTGRHGPSVAAPQWSRVRACPTVSAWWGPPVSGRCSRLQLMHVARARGLGSAAPLDL
jgi:hypothetical protein